jgi:hypothetical protein
VALSSNGKELVMKQFLFGTAVLVSQLCSANSAVDAKCDLFESREVSVKAASSGKVYVYGNEFISGHRWWDSAGNAFEVITPAELGGTNVVRYTIDVSHQQNETQIYVFRYKRSWEPESDNDTLCKVTVTKVSG